VNNLFGRAVLDKEGHHIFFNGGNALRVHVDPTVAIAACIGVSVSRIMGMEFAHYENSYVDKLAVVAEYKDGTPMRLSLEKKAGQLWVFLTVPDQEALDSFKARLQNYRDGIVDGDTYLDW